MNETFKKEKFTFLILKIGYTQIVQAKKLILLLITFFVHAWGCFACSKSEKIFQEFVRGNVAFTGILQELWKLDDDENAPLRRNSFLRFVALFSGVTRFYPGSQIPDNFDPTARAW